MPAVMDPSQFSTQQSLQTLATGHLVYTTSQILLDLTESSFAVPLATSSTSMVSAPQKHSIGNCGVVDSDPNSESAAQNRNLLVWNSSPGQKVHGDQADLVYMDQAEIIKDETETDVGNELQSRRTWDINNPLNLPMMDTRVALETFTTQAMWLIVQALLFLSIRPTLEAYTLTKFNAVSNTTGDIKENQVTQKKRLTRTLIFLFYADLVNVLSRVLLQARTNDRMTKKTREMASLYTEQQEKAQASHHMGMPACQQVCLGGTYFAAQSRMDINSTTIELPREKRMILNDQNTGRVPEVYSIFWLNCTVQV